MLNDEVGLTPTTFNGDGEHFFPVANRRVATVSSEIQLADNPILIEVNEDKHRLVVNRPPPMRTNKKRSPNRQPTGEHVQEDVAKNDSRAFSFDYCFDASESQVRSRNSIISIDCSLRLVFCLGVAGCMVGGKDGFSFTLSGSVACLLIE
jgi:hypothetical protein